MSSSGMDPYLLYIRIIVAISEFQCQSIHRSIRTFDIFLQFMSKAWSPMSQRSRRTWHPALHLTYNILIIMFSQLMHCFFINRIVISTLKRCFNLSQCMFQLAPRTGLVETLGLPPLTLKLTIIIIFSWMVYVAQIHVVRYA